MSVSIVIGGFAPGVGRTSIVAGLGRTYAALGRRVLLVDCDGDGDLAKQLDIHLHGEVPAPGLRESLEDEIDPLSLTQETSIPDLWWLGPGKGLQQLEDKFKDRIEDLPVVSRRTLDLLGAQFDVIVLDTSADPASAASFAALAGADVLLTLAPSGSYGAMPSPVEVQDVRMIQEEVNPGLRFAGTVVVEPCSNQERKPSGALAQSLGETSPVSWRDAGAECRSPIALSRGART